MTRRVGRNFGLGKRRGSAAAPEDDGAKRPLLSWIDLPPIWLLGFAVLAYLLAGLFPVFRFAAVMSDPVWGTVGAVLIGLALALTGWAAMTFAVHRTTLLPGETPTALVTTGPYAWSRNPIYVADVVLLVGWCMLLGAITPFLLIVPFARILEYRFILPEEARLEATFPDDFADWSQHVRRWV